MVHLMQGIRIPDWNEIQGYFTDTDVQHMLAHTDGRLNLHDCASVLQNAAAIYAQVSSGKMPPGNPWGADKINGFYSWWMSNPTCANRPADPVAREQATAASGPSGAGSVAGPTTVTNPITRHRVTLLGTGGQADSLWGWIQLINGTTDAGYVYFLDTPGVPMPADYLGSTAYVVMHLPVALYRPVLDILRNEAAVSIRFYQNSPTEPAFTFLETQGNSSAEALMISRDRLAR